MLSGLSGEVWLGHPKPRDDELLSSWLVRIASSNGAKVHGFCAAAWPGLSVWNRDIDKCAEAGMLALLAEKTGTPSARVRETTLADFEGRLYERHNPFGNTSWIMPIGVYHRTHRDFGLQFCPRCLSEGPPYYRRVWRLAFVTACTSHGSSLLDRCPRCRSPVNFHRHDLGDRHIPIAELSVRCHDCKYDFRRASRFVEAIDPVDLTAQQKLLDALGSGLATLPTGEKTYAHLYFSVLHQLMRLIAIGRRSAYVRSALRLTDDRIEAGDPFSGKRPVVEDLPVSVRRAALRSALWLLGSWPERFVQFCSTNRMWESWVLKDFDQAPYWFWSTVHSGLYKTSINHDVAEIANAVKYLRRSGSLVNQMTVSRLLGARDVFRKRSGARYLLNASTATAKV